MQHDPMRQRMLMKTEMRVRVADAAQGHLLEREINGAIAELALDDFSVVHLQPLGEKLLIIAQRVTAPGGEAAVPSPPGANGTQAIEVSYHYIERGDTKQKKFGTLMAAVTQASEDSDKGIQPIAIHVSSVTSYSVADIMAMKGRRT